MSLNPQDRDHLLFFLFFCFSFMLFGIGINYGNAHPYTYTEPKIETVPQPTTEATTEAEPSVTEATTEADRPFVVVIDAGHGGVDTGAFFMSEEGKINEKTVNFKIAKYLKSALERYDNVTVLMTRNSDKFLELQERSDFAINNDADVFVSVHNNTLVGAGGPASGSSVAVSMGNYKENVGQKSQELGVCISYELKKLGLKENGLIMHSSQSYTYPNGRAADYYATIRNVMEDEIVSVIVEHAFIDNEDDFYDFLCTKDQLKKIAKADARAIARFLQLPSKKTGKVPKALSNYKIKICHTKKNGTSKRYSKRYFTN